MTRKERYTYVLNYFRKHTGHVSTELMFGSAFQLLCATLLSAQCTDKRINAITPELFRHYPDAKTMAKATVEEVLEYVKSVSYPNAKAKHLVEMSKMLVEKFGGEVPSDPDALVMLPGVGRKTANVVMSVAFHAPAIAVDTHVFRVANRLRLAVGKTPLEVEKGLQKAIPRADWSDAHHWLILHGRQLCKARKPLCGECPLAPICPSAA